MGYFEPDGERMRKVLCLRNDVRNVSFIDGTGYFSSNTVHCDSYSMKTNSKTDLHRISRLPVRPEHL